MKAVNKLAVLLSLGALISAVAFATADEQAYLESCRKGAGVPVPVTVVAPTVGPEFNGGRVDLEFIVDASGKPTEFNVVNTSDEALAKLVVSAVKQWRFNPVLNKDGAPVATKVALPVKIVDEGLAGPSLAMK